jgi:hypothetical protein
MQRRGDKGRAAVMRQAAVVEDTRPCGHRRPRGIEDALPQLHLMRAEHGNPVKVRCASAGKPTVRRAEFRGGNRMPKKRRPAAERQQETGTGRPLLQAAVPDNWPDTRPSCLAAKAG